jgi:hypothetical protein
MVIQQKLKKIMKITILLQSNHEYNFIAHDGSVIPIDPEVFYNLSDEKKSFQYYKNHGDHFSQHNID